MEASHSRVKTWRRCHKLYDYKYNQRLRRKRPPPPLLKGSILHEMLDARAMKMDANAVLTKYAKEYKTLFIEEQELYGDIIDDLRRVYEGYCEQYADDGYTTVASEEFVATDIAYDLRFIGYIDKVVADKHGRLWLKDHKTGRNIPDAASRYSDLQLLMYVWARNREKKTEKISGIIWDYIRTKPPTIPELLKKGGLSIAKNVATDYRTFMAAIVANDLNPRDYHERLEDLKTQESPFYRRVTLPNPPTMMVEQVVKDFQNTAIELHTLSGVSTARNMTKDCSFCEYFSVCDAELRGQDSEFIKKSDYIIKEPSEHGDEEIIE